jgi:hypothetical protein
MAAYCPKCGVKVKKGGLNCPLCEYPIPDVDEREDLKVHPFPTPENIYPEEFKKVKKKVLKSITLIFGLAIIIMYAVNMYLQGEITWAKYSIASTISLWVYIGIFLKFIPSRYFYLTAASINTLGLLYALDYLSGAVTWFFQLGLPLVLGLYLFSLLAVFTYSYLKNRLLIYVAVNMIFATMYFFLLEWAISIFVAGAPHFIWSLIAGIPTFLLALALIYFHYYFPINIKEEIKRRFHI